MRALGQPWELAVFLWVPLHPVRRHRFHRAAPRRLAQGLGDLPHGGPLGRARPLAVPARDHGCAGARRQVRLPAGHGAVAHATRICCPVVLGKALFLVLALGSVLLALDLLGVRDWRCYGLALLTAPVVDTVSLGAISSMLLLGVALAWRYRDRPFVAGAVTAVTAVAKVFVWPLFVWLLATRRFRAALVAARSVRAPGRGRLGRDRFRRARRIPPSAAGAHEGGRGEELFARRVAAGRRRRGHGAERAPRDRGDRRDLPGRPRRGRRSAGARRSPSPARFSPRRCCGCTTSTCCSSPSLSPARGCRRSGSRRSCSGSRRSRTRAAASGGSASCSLSSAYVVWRTVDPAASVAAAPRSGRAESPHALAFVLTSAAIGFASSWRSRTRAG